MVAPTVNHSAVGTRFAVAARPASTMMPTITKAVDELSCSNANTATAADTTASKSPRIVTSTAL